MGAILDELLDEIKTSEVDEQVKILCDTIQAEEVPDMNIYHGPIGPNIFLSLQVPGIKLRKHTRQWITLERESQNAYVIIHYESFGDTAECTKRRVKIWEIKDDRPKKMIKEFAEKLNYLKGD